MYTEDEAKKKWCPMIRNAMISDMGPGQALTAVNQDAAFSDPLWNKCMASSCMMWRWIMDYDGAGMSAWPTDKGFCGLSGIASL
jgi:hypothetical protein